MLHNVDATLVLAMVALVLSGLSPVGFWLYQRKSNKLDDRALRRKEDEHRVQVVTDALELAKRNLITSTMEYELECVQQAIRASEEAVALKEKSGVPVLTQTLAAISALKEQAHAVEVEIVQRKEHSA